MPAPLNSGARRGGSRLKVLLLLLVVVVIATLVLVPIGKGGYPNTTTTGTGKENSRGTTTAPAESPIQKVAGDHIASGAGGDDSEPSTPANQQRGGKEGVRAEDLDRPRQCPQHRYLYIGNTFGRHNNQLMSLATAIMVARKLDRTLVISPFSDGTASANQKGSAPRIEVDTFYDIDALHRQECIIMERDWVPLMKKDIVYHFQDHADNETRRKDHIPAACITMRGIKTHPQQPIGSSFTCKTNHFVKFKKQSELFYQVAKEGAAGTAAVLTVPLVIYQAESLSPEEASYPWRYIQPKPVIKELVGGVIAGLRTLASTFDAESETESKLKTAGKGDGQSASSLVVGVHYRSLEGSCAKRVLEFVNPAHSKKLRAVTDQCEMSPAYITGIISRSRGGPIVNAALAVADDGQRPERVASILSAVPSGKGVRMSDLSTRGALVPPLLQLASANILGVAQRVMQGRESQDPRDVYTRNVPMLKLLVDFWTLVSVDVFIGNQLSTLSLNVCRARMAAGKDCENFVLRPE